MTVGFSESLVVAAIRLYRPCCDQVCFGIRSPFFIRNRGIINQIKRLIKKMMIKYAQHALQKRILYHNHNNQYKSIDAGFQVVGG